MLGHMLDHFIFSSRRFSEKTKLYTFGGIAFTIFACFWWFKGVSFGIDGPINEHWGLGWRKVSILSARAALLSADELPELEYLQSLTDYSILMYRAGLNYLISSRKGCTYAQG